MADVCPILTARKPNLICQAIGIGLCVFDGLAQGRRAEDTPSGGNKTIALLARARMKKMCIGLIGWQCGNGVA